MNLADFDVIHIRTDPPFNVEYYYTTLLVERASSSTHRLGYEPIPHSNGPLILNKPESLRTLNEKLAIFYFPEYVTDSLCTYNVKEACDFVASLGGRAVAKELATCSSKGVTLLQGGEEKIRPVLERLTNSGEGPILLQRFLEKVKEGETRVTLIDGLPLGYMTKIPAKDNFLASMDFGATSKPCVLTAREEEISLSVGSFLKDRGVIFAALDLIDGHLSEINVTSPGLLKHTNEIMGIELEAVLEDKVEEWLKLHRN
jgi:glutathione synthase